MSKVIIYYVSTFYQIHEMYVIREIINEWNRRIRKEQAEKRNISRNNNSGSSQSH